MSFNLLETLRAKSEGDQILLKDHLLEALRRVKQLKRFVENNRIEIRDFNNFFDSLAIAAVIHDLGKINYKFQKDMYKKDSENWGADLEEFLKPSKGVRIKDHEILSAIWASILLPDNDEWSRKIRTAVLLHHYNTFYTGEKDLDEILQNYQDDVTKYIDFIEEKWVEFERFFKNLILYFGNEIDDDLIKTALEKIVISKFRVNEFKKRIEIKVDLSEFAEFYEINNDNPDYNFLFFIGCLRRCDYSASGDVSIEKEVVLEELYCTVESNIKERIKASLWQEKLLENANGKSMVLVAPTGAGKTEFAILWAKNTGKKLIYTLPLRVALNDLFKRFNDYTPNNDENVGLLHSTAFIEYVTEEKSDLETDIEKKIASANLLSYPLMLSTPDQVFLASLNYYGSDKIISVYPLSSFVIDEVQTYNPEMASIIIKTLKIIQELRGTILVMTATLPPYFEPFFFGNSDLVNEIDKKNKKIYCDYNLCFKKLDTVQIKDEVKNYTLKRHKINVIKNENLIDDDLNVNENVLINYLNKLKNSGKRNNFIVVNTVSKAIKIYESLKDKVNKKELNDEVFLLHSRLIEKVKDVTINKIKEKLKRNDQENGIIVVATQIIEASVDLDFDGMITEISPIDSQIQRWGRIYRKRGNREYNGDPNIYIFAEVDRRTRNIYSGDIMKEVLEETINVLEKFKNKVLNYEDERQMVDLVFKKEINGKTIMAGFINEICENLDFLKYFSVEKRTEAQKLFRNIAGFQAIVPTIMKLYGEEWHNKLAKLIEDNESKRKTWIDIEKEVGADKWRIKKALYQYSVNIPVFYFQKLIEKKKRINDFKEFYVLKVDKDDAKIIYEFGLDKFMKDKLEAKNEEDILETSIL